jgi:cell shape-determining protein MreC
MGELDAQIEAAAKEYAAKNMGQPVPTFKAGSAKMKELMQKENATLKETIRRYEHETETIKELKEVNAQLKEQIDILKEDLDAAKEVYILISELYDKHMAVGG